MIIYIMIKKQKEDSKLKSLMKKEYKRMLSIMGVTPVEIGKDDRNDIENVCSYYSGINS